MASIYIYSPSGVVRARRPLHRAVRRLQAMGHECTLDVDVLARYQRFAGDDEVRLAAIARAAASGADLALITRGGYGITRLLPRLPYEALARATERGTRFVGLSDFTALQLALLQQTGAVTWAGPTLCGDFGTAEDVDDIMLACFDDMVCGASEGTGWRLPAADAVAYGARLQGTLAQDALLWGGNLTMVCALLGTPWLPQVTGGVLFLEDVDETPYRIERMLVQLLHAGVLARQQAVVLGQFSGAREREFSLAKAVEWLRAQMGNVPVLTGLPFGHVPTKVLLPVGARVDVDVQGREALLLWGHLGHGAHA
ncbi:MAG: LD-carboxypeptidase [Ottowia sp.]|nr:LD-carboxypeptidase [Ottowia sp.]